MVQVGDKKIQKKTQNKVWNKLFHFNLFVSVYYFLIESCQPCLKKRDLYGNRIFPNLASKLI